ncbi:CIC11C00000005177 [Sungouiella intermedia]|uniref:CIC11C00000005177 n=1 Tax=Sungouiella intermedia TaxID=45354 RepID=A0A1L0BEY3_9ASCO|nr:CIC11C00000005177 [[Candida] intermedia]
MAALMNRMRSDSRKQVREHGSDRVHKNKLRLLEEVKKNQANKKRTKQLEEEDSDEEQLKQSQIGAKKTVRMEFGKGKKRPF